MENRNGTPVAVFWAAVLHLGIAAFLWLAITSCTFWEEWGDKLGIPREWNPLKCEAPILLPGQPIEAVLIGPTGAPPPKHTQKPVPNTVPPPPAQPTPTPPQPEKPKVETLPPPPKTPAPKDQEKVVDDAVQKAEDAKKVQEEQQRQRQSELDAQEEKRKEKQKQIDDIFKQLDAAKSNTKQADTKKKQAEQQLKDLANAKDDGREDLPFAEKPQTGQNGKDDSKQAAYIAAIQNAVTQNWLRPENIGTGACIVHVVQIPGGQVLSAKVDSSCPFDGPGRASLENAVLRAQPLPYQGFEDVFKRDLTFTFRP